MWDHGAPALFRWLLAAYAGYTVTRALFRWVATVRVLGIRRTLSGARRMSSVRYKQIWMSDQGAASWLPIRPSVPVLFELQVFAYVVLVSWLATWRGSTALAFFDSAILLPAGVLALAHASESILPPCILYLGVSEPGQLKPFQFLAGSRNVLTVSALDQENLDVAAGEAAATGALSGLLVPDWIGRIPLAALVPRRRLESIRVRDDAWEGVVRQMIEFAIGRAEGERVHRRVVAEDDPDRPHHIVRDFAPTFARMRAIGLVETWRDGWLWGHQLFEKRASK